MHFNRMERDQLPGVFLIVITMAALAVFIQIDRMKNKSADLRAKAYQQTSTGVRVEAEEMTLNGVSLDPTGTYIQLVPLLTGTIAQTPTPYMIYCPPDGLQAGGTATIDVDLNKTANYKMWIEMMGGGDNENSLWLRIDQLYCVKVGDLAGMPANTWQWVDYQNGDTSNKIPTPILGTGHHLITIMGNEPGVSVDRFLMMIDNTCIPTGNGDACLGIVSTPTPTPTPPPVSASVSTPTPTPKKSSSDAPIITTTILPRASRNVPYTANVVATDMTISDTLGMTVSQLPSGLTLQTCSQTTDLGGTTITCPIAGTPTTRGTYFPVFTVTDAAGHQTSKRIKLQVE